jgi:serine/threonine protein kinase
VNEGERIAGRYVLLERIGAGGMGEVWRAEQEGLAREVAIKVMQHDRATDAMRGRFKREAEISAQLAHRNVIDILDHGLTEAGDPFLVMPLLKGETLASRFARSPAPKIGEVLTWMRSVLSGLAAIHDAGIVHRDLKPANVFLARDADGILPKLLDFGISRVQSGPQKSASLTQLGAAIGTPQYMAPEQFESARTVDHRADLYSAGAILYEALTGRPPYEGEDAFAIYREVLQGSLTHVSAQRSDLPRELADLVHRALEKDPARELADLVHRALEKDPDARFQSAREMRDAIDALRGVVDAEATLMLESAGTPDPEESDIGTAATMPHTIDLVKKKVAATRDMSVPSAPMPTREMGPERTHRLDSEPPVSVQAPAAEPRRSSSLVLWSLLAVLAIAGVGLLAFFAFVKPGESPRTTDPVTPAIGEPAPNEETTSGHRIAGPDRLHALALAWARLDPSARPTAVRLVPHAGAWAMIASPETSARDAERFATALGGQSASAAWDPAQGLEPVLMQTHVRLNVHGEPDRRSETLRVLVHGTIVVGLRGTIDGIASGGEEEGSLVYFVVSPSSAGWALTRFLRAHTGCLPAIDRLLESTDADAEALASDAMFARTYVDRAGVRENVFAALARDRGASRSYIATFHAGTFCALGERISLHRIEGLYDEAFFSETARSGGDTLLFVSAHAGASPPPDGVLSWSAYPLNANEAIWTEELATGTALADRMRAGTSGSRDRIVRAQREHYVLSVRVPGAERAWYRFVEGRIEAVALPEAQNHSDM